MTHRLHYIDNLKGVLILLVVLGHCIQCTDLDFDHNAVFRYIYSFHMPLFMCVSGFVSYKPDIKWQTVQKRFRQLIIPFLAWVAVSCCVHLDPTLFLAKVVHPDSGLWFLWTLFFIVLLMWLCNWIVTCLKVKIEYVVCFFSLLMMGIMVALKFKLFGFQFIAWYFPFYAIGFFGRKYQYLWEKRGRVDSLWFSALFLCMAYWWMRKDPPLFMPPSSHVVYNYVYKFMVAGVAIAAFIPLFKYYVNKPLLIFTKWGGGGGGNLEPHIIDDTMRCRKLTPLECFRLMGFTDEDFEKVKTALNETFYKGKDRSNSQLYKLAGNSISVPMLEYLFCQMFDDENKLWI